jgi:hypothetical protein
MSILVMIRAANTELDKPSNYVISSVDHCFLGYPAHMANEYFLSCHLPTLTNTRRVSKMFDTLHPNFACVSGGQHSSGKSTSPASERHLSAAEARTIAQLPRRIAC